MPAIGPGSVNTTWKYGTGSRSASRAASQSFAAAPWHFGQWRLRQELYEIWVYAHFSQRATCPPSAAVRQLSIADITFNWPRLTWPALARRHAGPWPRKISATSSDGRDTCRASGGRLSALLELARNAIERAHDLPDGLGGDTRIERGGVELGMSQQDLDHPDIGVLLQKMGRKAVTKGVRGHRLADLGHLGRGIAGAPELARRHRVDRVHSGKQPALRACRLVPRAQQLKQMRRQHHVAVFVTLALFDPDHHALAVDVEYLQRDHLGHAQSGPIGHAQCHLVFEPRCRTEKTRDFLRAQDHRQFAWHVDKLGMVHDVGAPKRDLEKEPQCRDALIEGRNAGATRRQMKLIAAYVFEARRVGRSAEEGGEVLDPLHVVMLSLRRELADHHVFDHALPQRAYGLIGHGGCSCLDEGCEPLISRQDAPPRYRVACVGRRGALPRERFSPLALFGHGAMSDLSPLCV